MSEEGGCVGRVAGMQPVTVLASVVVEESDRQFSKGTAAAATGLSSMPSTNCTQYIPF